MTSILLPPEGRGVEIELLPQGCNPKDVFGQGSCIAARVGAVDLMWQQNNLLHEPNPLASAVVGMPIRGDCVATVSGHRTEEALAKLAELTVRRPVGAGQRHQKRSQQLCLQQVQPYVAEEMIEVEPCTPNCSPLIEDAQAHAPQAVRNDTSAYAYDPRQQLMWTLAGQATSMNWEATLKSSQEQDTVLPHPSAVLAAAGRQSASEDESRQQRSTTDNLAWQRLQPEIIGYIIAAAGHDASFARTVSQVSCTWRAAMAADCCMWQQLRFSRISFAGEPSRQSNLPWLVVQAVKSGNLSASLTTARFYELYLEVEAGKHWERAARLGHPEAQWQLGLQHHRQRDSEEAMTWLSRAAKQLVELVLPAGQQEGIAAFAQMPGLSGPLLMTAASCCRILSQAAHVLGCFYLDGEGAKQDTAAAVKWLKTADRYGCTEAGRLLGSLFNTGQY